jgi:glycerate dehydrogenase
MSAFNAVFLDVTSLNQNDLDLEPLRNVFSKLDCYEHTSSAEIIPRLQGAHVAIVNKVVLSADVLKACPELQLILVSATGLNNVDLHAAEESGVTVCNCQGYGTATVAQHTLMLLLAMATSLPDYQRAVREGRWQTSTHFCFLDFPIVELDGKTLGVLGSGEIGNAVARLGEALGMRVIAANLPGRSPKAGRVSLDELLQQADAITLHCPLNENTRHLIGEAELAKMKPHAFIVNTARGGLIDEQALADALRRGHLGGAATDVLAQEPPVDGSVLLAHDIPRLIVTPHTAWGSQEARQRIVGQVAENAAAFRSGKSVRQVV